MYKTILIIGDSWGVPNYSKGWDTPPDAHTEFRLRELGYKVFNCSLNGGSMTETIEYAKALVTKQSLTDTDLPYRNAWKHKRNTYAMSNGELEEIPLPDYKDEKIDWILWFHTEAIRDTAGTTTSHLKLEEVHRFYSIAAYRAFQSLVDLIPNVKTAVIGGQAIVDPMFTQFHQPTFMIEDWRSEIVGRKLPRVVSLSRLDIIENTCDTKDEKLHIMDAHNQVYDAMKDTDMFFDRCHPSGNSHKLLTQKLHTVFQSS